LSRSHCRLAEQVATRPTPQRKFWCHGLCVNSAVMSRAAAAEGVPDFSALHPPCPFCRDAACRVSCVRIADSFGYSNRESALTRAAREFGLSLSESYMVGDGLTDIEAGHRAGCRTVFIGPWKPECRQFIRPPDLRPTFVAKDLWEVVQRIQADLSVIAGALSSKAGNHESDSWVNLGLRARPYCGGDD
jgi:hypothetical protein